MTIVDFCGGVAIYVACLIVLFVLFLGLMLGMCVVLGAYESVSNPHASEDARVQYQNITAEISTGTAGMDQAVLNVTGGG
jgi:hypothetical protein